MRNEPTITHRAHDWRFIPGTSPGQVRCMKCGLACVIGDWPAQRCVPERVSARSGFKPEE